jgi:hypothetical protein
MINTRLTQVDQYQHTLNNLATIMALIHKSFISEDSSSQVNIPANLVKELHSNMRVHVQTTLPALETLFGEIQKHVQDIVYTDIYPPFVRQQLALSAAKALSTDKHQYGGLGDCFCLTDPR